MIGQYTYFFSRHILSWFIILENIISPYIIYYSYITWFCQCPSKKINKLLHRIYILIGRGI